MEIYYAWSQLENYRSLSVVLGSNWLTDCLTPPSLLHSFLPCFQLHSVELIVLDTKTHATVLQVCFHSNNLSDPCESLSKGLQGVLFIWQLEMIYLEGFLKTFPTPLTGVLHCQMHI